MADYVKHEDGDRSLFLIPVKQIDRTTIYLDFTKMASGALKRDKTFDEEKGPNFAQEVHKANEYAEYLQDCKLNQHNLHRYGTKDYTLFAENA